MPRRPRDVTEAELAVLESLWELGPVPVRRLIERLYPDGGPSAYPTVQKLLERLEAKGHVGRVREGGVFVYGAKVDRATLVEGRLKEVADDLCGGSMATLLTQLVDSQPLPASQRAALREFLESLDKPPEPDDRR